MRGVEAKTDGSNGAEWIPAAGAEWIPTAGAEWIPTAGAECRAAEKEEMVPLKEPRRRRNIVYFRQPLPAYPAEGSVEY